MRRFGHWLSKVRGCFEEAGYIVQSLRLATPPFCDIKGLKPEGLTSFGKRLEDQCRQESIDFVSVGPARISDPLQAWDRIPSLIGATDIVFSAGELANRQQGIDTGAVHQAARVIHQCGLLRPDGLGNLRFAALANVKPNVPFLPAAYHSGDSPCFALAMEAADLAVDAFRGAGTLVEATNHLIRMIEDHARRLTSIARSLGGPRFSGIDFSLAPFPEVSRSIGTALESMGLSGLGYSGSLTAAGILTHCIDQAKFVRTGFNGLFLSLLEDTCLARRASEEILGIDELLLYSAVCGTGLDTVPLPGDISADEIVPILLDMATLALRLDKPLTARLMPMPGKAAGDYITFDFPYFTSGRVLNYRSRPLRGLLLGAQKVPMGPREKTGVRSAP